MSKKINVIIFISILFVLGTINLSYIANRVYIGEADTSLIREFNHSTLLSGEYFSSLDNFFNDNLLYRDKFLKLDSLLEECKGIKFLNEMEIYASEGVNVAGKMQENGILSTDWGNILIENDKAMEINTYNADATKRYYDAINRIASKTSAKVYSMLVPTQIEFESDKIYKDVSYSQKNSIDDVYSHYNNNVKSIDVYETLSSHSDEYIYLRTDHHWTALGAYYAYCEFAKAIGEEPIALTSFQKLKSVEYLGSLYNLTLNSNLEKYPDIITAYLPIRNCKYMALVDGEWIERSIIEESYLSDDTLAYASFLGGDSELSIIESDTLNNRSILVVKDSYANAFIPFLVNHYQYIYIIDPRMYTGNFFEFIDNKQIDEILFLNYALVNRYTGYADYYMEYSEE